MKQSQNASPPTPDQPIQIVYRHKTVSIPPWAYKKLEQLRNLVSKPTRDLPDSVLASLDKYIEDHGTKYTFGVVFGAVCDWALSEIEKHHGRTAAAATKSAPSAIETLAPAPKSKREKKL